MFAEDGGATFYPAQLNELNLMLARKEDGSPATQTIGISKPRQNGKSYAARYYAIYMADFEHRPVLYSAHHSSTTEKMFSAMCSLFENKERYPDFFNDVKSITRGRGYQGIYFKDWKDEDGQVHDGGCIEFSTRTNSGARGGTYSVIVIDEAQEMTSSQQEGMLPVISAASDISKKSEMPQQIYIGTPPGPDCHGDVFSKMHEVAHSEDESKLWWLEWSVDSFSDLTMDNVIEKAYETNPAMGYRISEDTILNEYEQMQIDGFARERLGFWSPNEVQIDYAIDSAQWELCKSFEQKPEGKTAYGVKFSPDGSSVALCGAVIPKEGKARISLINYRSTSDGLQWLADWLNERTKKASCVMIDGRNGVDYLIEKIKPYWKMKDSVIRAKTADAIDSASNLVNEIAEQKVTWFNGQEALNDSAITSTKRPIGGGWGFGGDNSVPIEAAALALLACRRTKRDPNRKMRIG